MQQQRRQAPLLDLSQERPPTVPQEQGEEQGEEQAAAEHPDGVHDRHVLHVVVLAGEQPL